MMNSLNVFRGIALILAATLLWTACKKSDNDEPKKPQCRIITMTFSSNGYTYNISYNADNKIESISEGHFVHTFQYSGNTIIINRTDNGTPDLKETVTLNQYGLATNVRNDWLGDGSWTNTAYAYSGKELIKATITYSYSSTPTIISYTWSNGNLVSLKSESTITTFDYYTDKPVQTGGYRNYVQMMWGFKTIITKNLVKSSIQGGAIEQYSYSYDKDGKITSMAIKRGGNTTICTYQYQCN